MIVQLYPTTQPNSAYPHQTSSCIFTTRPMPATLVERPATHNHDSTIPAIDITHPSSKPHTTAMDIYIYVCNSGNKIVTFVVSVILSPSPLHCLWLSQLTHALNPKIICGVNALIGSATVPFVRAVSYQYFICLFCLFPNINKNNIPLSK